ASSYADLALAVGIKVPRTEPLLKVSAKEKAEGTALVRGATVALQPGARHDYKRVPTEQLAAVGRALLDKGREIVLVGGAEEAPHGVALAQALGKPVIDLIGKTSIRQTLGVLANMDTAVGSDTGVMHLAAA